MPHTTSHPTPPNADAQELAHFASFGDDWWDTQGVFKTLHDINPLRLRWIKQHIDLTQCSVLDVGCGGGILAESMAQAGAHSVLGIDLAETALDAAKQHAQKQGVDNVQYQNIGVEDLAQSQAGQFDVVTCMEMLEHVPDPQAVVHACARLVKAGGWVFFSTLARNPKSYLMAIIGAEYVLRLLPRGTHSYDKFVRPSELIRYARQVQLHAVATTGLHYNPVMRSYSLHPNTDVNYLVACQKPL